MMSNTQPMDQGVMQSLKGKYHSLAVKKQTDALEKGNQLPKSSILTTMSRLMKAWNSIPDGAFTNCFKKIGISEKSYFKKIGISEKSLEKALNDEDDPFASLDVEEDVMESLTDDLEMRKEKFHKNYGMIAEELVDSDFCDLCH